MAHEIDGQGNIRIFTFTVHFTDNYGTDESIEWKDSDYARSWDRARKAGEDWCDLDASNRYEVSWDSEWISESEWESMQESDR